MLGQLVHLGVVVRAQVELAATTLTGRGQDGVEHVVRVHRAGGPAQHVKAGVAAQNFGEVRALGFGLEVDLHTHPRQIGGHSLADFSVVHIAVIGAIHLDLKAAGVAGFGQQLFGRLGVIGQAFGQIGSVAIDL